MVIENLQITPLAEWLLGAGWYNGWLWHWQGIALLLTVLLGGGFVILFALAAAGRPVQVFRCGQAGFSAA